ncbi:MAG: ferrous iron transport protein A [Polyangiaceae bacterium]|nr:ferrous iron transport protein A [Polyangiaceae bacterium]
MMLADIAVGDTVTVEHVGGPRAFRRRLMELGLLPGTRVRLVGVAPLGDPLELLVRGASLSIRRAEAESIRIVQVAQGTMPDSSPAASPARAS